MPMLSDLQEFLSWLVSCAFNHVHLGAAFPSRTTALSALVMLVNVMATNKPQAGKKLKKHYLDK